MSNRILISPTSLTENIPGTLTVTYQAANFITNVWGDINLDPDTQYILKYTEGALGDEIDISSNTTSSNPGAEIDFFVSSVNMPPVGDYQNQITLWSGGSFQLRVASQYGLFSVLPPPSNFVITQGTGIKSLNSIISANCPYFDKDANLSMNGKNILGINKLEVTNIVAPLSVAKICMGTHIINAQGEIGYLSFDIKEDIDAVTIPYLKLNGNTTDIDMLRPLKMNNKDISNVGTATTFNSNQLVPQRVLYTDVDAIIPDITDDGCRFVAINRKLPSSAEWNYGIGGLDGPITYDNIRQNVTASALYDELLWVGTDHGQLFYYDAGTWNHVDTGCRNVLTSPINCLQVYGNGRYLAVGGKFNPNGSTYNCMYAIHKDTNTGLYVHHSIIANSGNPKFYDGIPGDEVKCFYDNVSKDCLYIGGKFQFLVGTNATSTSFITFNYDTETWHNVFNNSNAGYNGFYDSGGNPGTVNSISVDSNTRIFVGGDFDIVHRAGVAANNSSPYLFIWGSSDGISYTDNITIVGGVEFDGPVSSLLEYGTGQMLIGGSFTVPINKGMVAKWNLAGAQYGIFEYPLISGGATSDITFIQQPYIGSDIFTGSGNTLYRYSDTTPMETMVTAIEVDSWNCVAYYNDTFLFASNITQNFLLNMTTTGTPATTIGAVITTSGSGRNATFDIDTTGQVSINTTGSSYAVGDSIKFGSDINHFYQIESLNFFEAAVLNGTSQNFYFHTYAQERVTLTSSSSIITTSSSSSRVTLLYANSSVELIWSNTLSSWFLLSQQGASFS
ncbi:hypothetical protein N9K75_01820 [bacterium]|nr:hypothetical protein [bacterium]